MALRVGVAALTVAGLGGSDAARVSKTRRNCGSKGSRAAGNETDIQIVNGDDAAECEWKWQVGLRYGNTGLPFCGGTLINEDWVMTAAHCGNRADFSVVAGAWKPRRGSSREQNRKAVELIRHPRYRDSRSSWDFSLVRLESSFQFNNCVGAACLPDGNDITAGSECWITGWGTLSSGGYQPSTLQEAKVSTISNEDCWRKYSYSSSQIDESMLCAQGKTASGAIVDACQGDSGGPLVCESNGVWTLYGATSWGRGCAGARYPGVWARIHEVMDWVDLVLASKRGEPQAQELPTCPAHARYQSPDSDGDCACPHGQKCSADGGASWNCPSSSGVGGLRGRYFSSDCEECGCFGA